MIRKSKVSACICLLLLAACSKNTTSSLDTPLQIWDGTEVNQNKTNNETVESGPSSGETRPRAQYFDGTGQLYNRVTNNVSIKESQGGEYSLNFTNTDIKTVLSAVLTDLMGAHYVMHPDISGSISLETAGSVDKEAVFNALEATLKLKGIALVPTSGGYQVVPLSQAPSSIAGFSGRRPDSTDLPGFTVQIVPLRFASPIEMRRILEPFSPPGGILMVDEPRRLLILAGTSQELSTMRQVIETFDLDWMQGMSFALYDLNYVDAETITKELLDIFGDANSPVLGAVRLIPIPRLNKILGISAQPDYLRQVENWVARLDIGGETPGRRIYVYHVQNGHAYELAETLGSILGEGQIARPASPVNTSQPSVNPTETNTFPNANQPAGLQTNQAMFEGRDIRIVPDNENNALLILAQPSDYAVIENALKQMDIEPRQVLIEVALAEITLTDDLRYGVQWDFTPGNNQVTLSEAASGIPAAEFPGFSYIYTGAADVRLVLNALEEKTDVNVVSYPKLMVLNNQSAILQIGDEVPVPVQSAVSVTDPGAPIVNSVQYRETGAILDIVPRINDGGLVTLEISQEISDVVTTTSSGIDAPTIQQRKITTTIAVRNGQTIALGGLIRESENVTKSGVPVLQSIPGLGNLFRKTNNIKRRTELIILLTPRVIQNVEETRDVMNYLRDTFVNLLPPKDE